MIKYGKTPHHGGSVTDQPERPEIATCSFSEFQPDMGVPIRTSRGAPRWKLKYDIAGVLLDLAPEGHMFHMARPQFTDAYERKLETIGVEELQVKFGRLIAANGGRVPLVMLCFEKLYDTDGAGQPKWCHRTIFAHWWTRKTGVAVPELGSLTAPAKATKKATPAADGPNSALF
jgi:hypothetical protein